MVKPRDGEYIGAMDARIIFGLVAIALFAAYFLFFRSIKAPPEQTGRPDRLERPEMTGNAQYEHRKTDKPNNV
jgi:hypothetical protein